MTSFDLSIPFHSITPGVMTLAGFDPSGGAGLQADMKTIHALGGYAFTVPTAMTVQNSQGVYGVEPVKVELWLAQAQAIVRDVDVRSLKIGMLATAETVEAVAELIEQHPFEHVILDPVLVSSSGAVLLAENAIEVMKDRLLPKITVLTPNLPEAAVLLASEVEWANSDSQALSQGMLHKVSDAFQRFGVSQVVLKGGHGPETTDACDYLLRPGTAPKAYCSPRISGAARHGTGCTFASALATFLAHGLPLESSVSRAKAFMNQLLSLSDEPSLSFHDSQARRQLPLRPDLCHSGSKRRS